MIIALIFTLSLIAPLKASLHPIRSNKPLYEFGVIGDEDEAQNEFVQESLDKIMEGKTCVIRLIESPP